MHYCLKYLLREERELKWSLEFKWKRNSKRNRLANNCQVGNNKYRQFPLSIYLLPASLTSECEWKIAFTSQCNRFRENRANQLERRKLNVQRGWIYLTQILRFRNSAHLHRSSRAIAGEEPTNGELTI